MKVLLIIIMLGFSALGVSAGKVYKWVDEEGNVHYSSRKPANQNAEKMKIDLQQPAAQESAGQGDEPDSEAEEEAENEESEELDEQSKAELARINKKHSKKVCDQAKKNLAALQATPRVTERDPETGELVRLDDKQRASALKRARENIKEFCR